MPKGLLLLLIGTAAWCASEGWGKVGEIKRGTELRIYQTSAKHPLSATMDEEREDAVVVIVKNAQIAIPKAEIERIDARSGRPESRVSHETKSGRESRPSIAGAPQTWGRAASSTSATVKISSKPDFETVYRRAAP